jgi:hypothetical protein
MPSIDLPSGYTWFLHLRRPNRFDGQILEGGPFRCFTLRLPLFGRTLVAGRMRTRWR